VKFYALTAKGLSSILEQEIQALGVEKVQIYQGGVLFEADWDACYRANLHLRSSSRVLWVLKSFKATSGDEIYDEVRKIDFTPLIEPDGSIYVEASVQDSKLKDQRWVALRTKDALVDQFREKYDQRPTVVDERADLKLWVRVYEDQCILAIDTSGASLYRRGYRREQVPAPVKEHVAAGLLQIAGWKGQCDLVDLMCGSGTFLVEGAMIALNTAPGLMRKNFGFQSWKSFDDALWNKVVEDAMSNEKTELSIKLYGFDINRAAVKAAKSNVKTAGFDEYIQITRSGVDQAKVEVEKPGIVVVNPPYGERLEHDDEDLLKDAYRDLSFGLRTNFKGWTAWVLSPRKDLTSLMELKPSYKHQVWNGRLACEWTKYEIFS